MGQYCHTYIVPKGTRDRCIAKRLGYRTSFIEFMLDQPENPEVAAGWCQRITRPAFCDEFDSDVCWIMSAEQYLWLTDAYRRDVDSTYPSGPPMYIDDCSLWLGFPHDISDLEVIVAGET